MRRLKGDNRGLSLIEVLVSVMVLAIVIVPFLHSFITAATTNSKAKAIHKATVLAQSVMEGFKAEELEEIALQFDYPGQGFYVVPSGRIGGGTGVEALVGELRYNSGVYSEALNYENPALSGEVDKKAMVTASTYSEDMGVTGEFLGQSDGIYYFSMQDVEEDTSTYDILVKLDAAAYRTGVVSGVDSYHRYNGDKLTQLPVIDLEQDAMCIQKESYMDLAVADFLATFPEVAEDVIRAGLTRTITLSVDRTRVGTQYRTTVSVEYKYSYQHAGTIKEYVKAQTCFDSTEAGKDLRSVYLYYYPLYSSGTSRDEIIFKNNEKLPVNFYLMKQKGSLVSVANEVGYNLKLSLLEADATESSMQLKLFTNLATNLADGTEIGTPFYSVLLNGSAINLNNIASKDILVAEEADRMFDIAVSIYEPGAKNAGFPEDMRLTTLTGSRVN